jgi:hypothetical protein
MHKRSYDEMSSNPWSAAVPQRLETQLIHNAKLDIGAPRSSSDLARLCCVTFP